MGKDRFDIKEKEGISLMTGGLTPLLDSTGKPIVTHDCYQK